MGKVSRQQSIAAMLPQASSTYIFLLRLHPIRLTVRIDMLTAYSISNL
jgi:hypothetical protein